MWNSSLLCTYCLGPSCLNVLRGPLHFGQVVSGECKKGLYIPSEAKCNFAVPHINVFEED